MDTASANMGDLSVTSDYRKKMRPFIFGLSSIGVYAGAVNLGSMGFIPGVPFIIMLFVIIAKYEMKYRIASILVFLLCGGLYFLKGEQTPVFYPALGDSVTVASPLCIHFYSGEDEYSFPEPRLIETCKVEANSYYINRSEPINVGSKYTITGSGVSHPDFSENYYFVVKTEYGPLRVDVDYSESNKLFQKDNGDLIKASDLRRGIFHYPSMFLYYPIAPIMLSTIVL